MANPEHLVMLQLGVGYWNGWRIFNPESHPDLSEADLHGANLSGALFHGAHLNKANLHGVNLSGANLHGAYLNLANLNKANLHGANLSGAYLNLANLNKANLHGANLSGAYLSGADLSEADLSGAHLNWAHLNKANLHEANLSEADLSGADLGDANLSGAHLRGAKLRRAVLVETNLENADLTNCSIYGISAWNLKLGNSKQTNLVITHEDEPAITVDNLEVAQFIYLLLNRKKIREVLDTITSKAVLILGRFTPERKVVLDAMADELRRHQLLPIIFDFERSSNRDFTETIKILAGLSLFVIVDITKPKSAPQELQATVPDYQIPFVPIMQEGENEYSMFSDFQKYDWVLKPLVTYKTKENLLEGFKQAVVERAWKKNKELQSLRNQKFQTASIEDFIARSES